MYILKKTIKTALRCFLKEKIRLGTGAYVRRLLLPNLLSNTTSHEEFLGDIYKAVLQKKEGVIIDVGVNTGQTLFKMLSIDKSRPYFGFEPQSTPASSVETFLIDNKITHYAILPIALSDHNGVIPINVRGEGIDSMASPVASIVDGFRPKNFYSYAKYVYAAYGDEVIDSLNIAAITLIKVDVEGAELEVIRGLKATIEKYRPFILFEVLHHYLAVTKEELDKKTIDFRESRIQELEEIIRARRYHVYQIDGSKALTKTAKIEPKFVNDLASTDFIAVPHEHESEFCGLLAKSRLLS